MSFTEADALRDAAERASAVLHAAGYPAYHNLDTTLATLAERGVQDLTAFRSALAAAATGGLPYPVDTLRDLVNLVAAFRAAMRFTPTRTTAEIAHRTTSITPVVDLLRLHLVTDHGNLDAAGLSDQDARDQHWAEHHGHVGVRSHTPLTIRYSPGRLANLLDQVDIPDTRTATIRMALRVEARAEDANPNLALAASRWGNAVTTSPTASDLLAIRVPLAAGNVTTFHDACVAAGLSPVRAAAAEKVLADYSRVRAYRTDPIWMLVTLLRPAAYWLVTGRPATWDGEVLL